MKRVLQDDDDLINAVIAEGGSGGYGDEPTAFEPEERDWGVEAMQHDEGERIGGSDEEIHFDPYGWDYITLPDGRQVPREE